MTTFLKSFAAVALLSVAGWAGAVPVSGQGTWETTLQARDLDNDGTVDAYYDSALNISWLANANAYGDQAENGYWAGTMSWADANAWTASLNVAGTTGWRLPQVFDTTVSGHFPQYESSELAFMYYGTLGNAGAADDSTSMLSNTANFSGLNTNPYWFSNAYQDGENPTGAAWAFSMFMGYQGGYPTDNFSARVWAVHDGDVGAITAPVPEPETYALMLAGLVAIGFVRRRRGGE